MIKLLKEEGHNFSTSSYMEIVRDINEKLTYVAFDYNGELNVIS